MLKNILFSEEEVGAAQALSLLKKFPDKLFIYENDFY